MTNPLKLIIMDIEKSCKDVFLAQDAKKALDQWAYDWCVHNNLLYTIKYTDSECEKGTGFKDCCPISPTIVKIEIQNWDLYLTDISYYEGHIDSIYVDTITEVVLEDYEESAEEE